MMSNVLALFCQNKGKMIWKTVGHNIFRYCHLAHLNLTFQKRVAGMIMVTDFVRYFHTNKSMYCLQRSSSLHVSGDRGQTVFGVLAPYLEISRCLGNPMELESNLRLRKIDGNVQKLVQMWKKLQHMKSMQEELEEEKTNIAGTIGSLARGKDKSKKGEIDQLKIKGKEVREKLKAANKDILLLEDIVILEILRLPNILHHSVHEHNKIVLDMYNKPIFDFETKGHLDIGATNDDLNFVDNSPTAFYLKNRLSLLELSSCEYFTSVFKSHGFLFHSNPDFVKGVVVEGSGIHISEIDKVFMLTDHNSNNDANSQYLVGGASLQAFCAYYAKHVIDDLECLPQKLVTIGRCYLPTNSKHLSLFNCCQTTVVDGFVLLQNKPTENDMMIEEVLMALVHSYSQLKIHFQVKKYAAHNLRPHESAAIGIVMYSPKNEMYIEVARISVCGDYISKRLLMMHKMSNNSASFVSMIYVRVCNITHLLAIIMENGQTKSGSYEIPETLRKLMYL